MSIVKTPCEECICKPSCSGIAKTCIGNNNFDILLFQRTLNCKYLDDYLDVIFSGDIGYYTTNKNNLMDILNVKH